MAENTRVSRYCHSWSLRKAILPTVLVLTSCAIGALTVAATAQSSAQDTHGRVAQLAQPAVPAIPLPSPIAILPVLAGGEVHGSIYAVIREQATTAFAPMLPDVGV